MSIHVAIVEDDRSVRENLAEFIHGTPGFACVAACVSTEEALRRLPLAEPDVALVDINLPGKSGVDFVREFRSLCPRTQVIMLTVEADSQLVFESLKAGATGYLVKHVPPEEILDAIREVHAGGAPMSSQVARMVVGAFREPPPPKVPDAQLTAREADILRLLSCGDRSKEIADKLGIGVGTVNTHVRNIYEKLHVRSRAEAVARLFQS
jgi:DNA-binding NarL/FixJ family response regulator